MEEANTTDISPKTTTPETSERRSEERINFDERIEAYQDWFHTLREMVKRGVISESVKDHRIALLMVLNDLSNEKTTEIAQKDSLTGLYNRGAFDEYFESYVKSGNSFGLLIIDIDHFKAINDNHGHQTGDAMLFQIGMEIKSNIRQLRQGEEQEDMVARYGGDELVVLLKNIDNEEDLEKIAEKIRASVGSHPFSIRDKEIDATVSIGGGIFRNGDKETFFRSTDESLYKAKEQGRNKVVIPRAENKAA